MAGVMAKRVISTVSVTEEIPAAVRMVRPSAARRAVSRPVQAQAQIESTAPMEVQSYVVGSGDTLWKYAQIGMKPGDNVNDYVTYLMKLNHLDSADLTPGQRIIVPKH